MTTLVHRRSTPSALDELIASAPDQPAQLSDDHRRSLSSRFRAVATTEHRAIDAWMVEHAGRPRDAFSWSPVMTRRTLANAALRRVRAHEVSVLDAVNDEINELVVRAAAGYARAGSLASWLAQLSPTARSVVLAEASSWASQLIEISTPLTHPWSVAVADAHFDVAQARTSLRGRRDVVVEGPHGRVVVRVRAGAPGKSAGPGLRADLTVDALSESSGRASTRFVGLWPEAGVLLAVDGTMDDLRAGARDLVRTAVAWRRHRLILAA